MSFLILKDMTVTLGEKTIISRLSLTLQAGEIIAIMGPNGSGKSTLAHALMGDPRYMIQGTAVYDGRDLTSMTPDERSKAGIFLSFQQPRDIPGVKVSAFLRALLAAHDKLPQGEAFLTEAREVLRTVGLPEETLKRDVNVGFSGGERKRFELAQMLLLKPRLIILDEIDSGLDVDALRVVARAIQDLHSPERSFIIITHYSRILHHITPDRVIILKEGRLVKEGPAQLAWQIEEEGYAYLTS